MKVTLIYYFINTRYVYLIENLIFFIDYHSQVSVAKWTFEVSLQAGRRGPLSLADNQVIILKCGEI